MTLLPLPAADEAMLQGVRLKLVQMAVHNDHEFTCPGEVMDDMLQLIADLREVAANPPCTNPECECGASLDWEDDDGWYCVYCDEARPDAKVLTQAEAFQRALQQRREGTR